MAARGPIRSTMDFSMLHFGCASRSVCVWSTAVLCAAGAQRDIAAFQKGQTNGQGVGK